MYDQAIQNPNVAKSDSPIFQNLIERFEKQNAWQREGLCKIEDKLHQLLNRRTSEKKESDGALKPEIGDFSQAMAKQLSIMEENCKKIETLADHLRMIA